MVRNIDDKKRYLSANNAQLLQLTHKISWYAFEKAS